MSGNQYVFGAVDISSWEFSGENHRKKKSVKETFYFHHMEILEWMDRISAHTEDLNNQCNQ